MTSRSLFFKRMKQDLEQRIWLPVVFFIIGFLTTELPLISSLNHLWERSDPEGRIMDYLLGQFFTPVNGFIIITVGMSILSALSGFAYIHSAKKLDVYHSIPVKREALFVQQYVYGILYYLVPMVIHVLICLGICGGNFALTRAVFGQAVGFVVVQLLMYLVIYAVTVLAVCLTGNMVISVLGSGVLLVYSLILGILRSSLMDTFFMTAYSTGSIEDFPAFSPVHLIYKVIYIMEEGMEEYLVYTDYMGEYGKLLLMAAVYTVIALLLHKKRPTEAVSRSIAFPITEPVVKTMVVLPVSITMGYFFAAVFSYSDSFSWFVFGCIFGFIICCPLMEIIFRKDVKAVISHPLQLVFNGVCVIAILVIFKCDIFGYDTYIPKESEVESYAISFSEQPYIYGRNININTYRLENMTIIDNASTRALLENGAQITRKLRTEEAVLDVEEAYYTSYVVKYQLKNGREVYRSYLMNMKDEQVMQWVEDTYSDMQYKLGVYPVLSEKHEKNYIGVLLNYLFAMEQIPLSEDKMQEFLETYQRELTNLSFEQMQTEYPIAELTFAVGDPETDNEMGNEYVIRESATYYAETPGFRYSSEESGYMIYPSFTQTLALLEEYGAHIASELPAEDVVSMRVEDTSREVYDHDGYYNKVVEIEYTAKDDEQEKIAQILPTLTNYQLGPDFSTEESTDPNLRVYITYYYNDVERSNSFEIKMGMIPEFLTEDLNAAAQENGM